MRTLRVIVVVGWIFLALAAWYTVEMVVTVFLLMYTIGAITGMVLIADKEIRHEIAQQSWKDTEEHIDQVIERMLDNG
jgi:hypothetical protein